MTAAELKKVETALLKGPVKNGYRNDLWTLRRVAAVMARVTGRPASSTTRTWNVLREMGWSCQCPAKRARQQDPDAVAAFRNQTWTVVKKSVAKHRRLFIFSDESGLSEKPSIRSTWGQQGKAPVVVHSFSWAKRSMMGDLIYRWDGTPATLTFEIIEGSYNLERVVRWSHRLVKHLAGAPAYLIWDRLQAHRSKAVREFLLQHGVEVILLPGYSPNLNPTEWLWAHRKGKELANFCAKDIAEAEDEARRGIRRVRTRPSLMAGFLAGAGLYFG